MEIQTGWKGRTFIHPACGFLEQVHPRFKRDALGVSSKREDPLTRSDFLLDSRQWSSLIVGKISEVWRMRVSMCVLFVSCQEALYAKDATSAVSCGISPRVAYGPHP